jgi:hypothetical protein
MLSAWQHQPRGDRMWVSLRRRRRASEEQAGRDQGSEGREPAGRDVARTVHAETAAHDARQEAEARDPGDRDGLDPG